MHQASAWLFCMFSASLCFGQTAVVQPRLCFRCKAAYGRGYVTPSLPSICRAASTPALSMRILLPLLSSWHSSSALRTARVGYGNALSSMNTLPACKE
uniref:Putative secreted protein n=1 Tax=Hyalomma excavatum TaxID=257692 RepID=A0A131XJI2_9ACAR